MGLMSRLFGGGDDAVPSDLRRAVEGAYHWMVGGTQIGSPMDDVIAECDPVLSRLQADVYVGVGLGGLLVFLEASDPHRRHAPWGRKVIYEAISDNKPLLVIVPAFEKYFVSELGREKDLDMIAGNFICNQIGMASAASDRVRGVCSQQDIRKFIGRQVLLRSNFCLKGHAPPR